MADVERVAEDWACGLLSEFATDSSPAVSLRLHVPRPLLSSAPETWAEQRLVARRVTVGGVPVPAASPAGDPEQRAPLALPPAFCCHWGELASALAALRADCGDVPGAVRVDVYVGDAAGDEGYVSAGAVLVSRDEDDAKLDVLEGVVRRATSVRYTRALSRALAARAEAGVVPDTRTLLALAGHPAESERARAAAMLCREADGHDWKHEDVRVRCVGEEGVARLEEGAEAVEVWGAGGSCEVRKALRGADGKLSASLGAFERPGAYDWRAVKSGTGGEAVPTGQAGRFVVTPDGTRDLIVHCVWPPLEGSNTFGALAKDLPRIQNDTHANLIQLAGAFECEPRLPLLASNRSAPCSRMGGEEDFKKLIAAAKAAGMRIGVDFPMWPAARSHHRKYDPLLCRCVDPRGTTMLATMGDYAVLNYRKLEAWEMTVREICEWADRGVSAIRLQGPWPVTFPACEHEMGRVDSDGVMHYGDDDIVFSPLLDAERITSPYAQPIPRGSAHPFLARVARAVWAEHPEVILLVDTSSDRGQVESAAMSGFVPVSTSLYAAMAQSLRSRDWPRSQPLESLFARLRDELPDGAVSACVSSASLQPQKLYPSGELGQAAWAAVNVAFLGPLLPITLSGEHSGWRQVPAASRRTPSPSTVPSVEIRGHYSHRSELRSSNSVLRTGAVLPLRCLRNGDKGALLPCPQVSAFVRFDSLDKEFAICAVNLSESLQECFVDCATLADVIQTGEEVGVFVLHDLIDISNPPQYLSRGELLGEQHLVAIPPYGATCWRVEVLRRTPKLEEALYDHSIGRLARFLSEGLPPDHNMVYEAVARSIFNVELFEEALEELFNRLSERGRRSLPRVLQMIVNYVQQHASTALAIPVLKRGGDSNQLILVHLLEQVASSGSHPCSEICAEALKHNELRPIVFLTPELGRFSTVGGIGVVADELSRSLAKLGVPVYVISPYYNYDKYGHTGYLESQGAKHLRNVSVRLAGQDVTIGVHELVEDGVRMLFLHNFDFFPFPYAGDDPVFKLKTAVVLARGALETCAQFGIHPSVFVTNDWLTGLAPPYANFSFGNFFSSTRFFHLIHNAEKGYEGRLFVPNAGALSSIHGVPSEIIQENDNCLNLSWAALKSVDNWGTVSKSYQQDIINTSSLSFLLRLFPHSFAQSNGIKSNDRLAILRKIIPSLDHWEAKRKLQSKYFGFEDGSIPVFGFVGRICEQKGVELLCHVARRLIHEHHGRIQIIVGGFAPKGDPYAQRCSSLLYSLKSDFPRSIWADPGSFFLDGALLNIGCDFALMPSMFEPSGVVQQEFFLPGTPVIAFKTGGLKDTVFEFQSYNGTGNGFTFEAFNGDDLRYAISRALRVYYDQWAYGKIRENAKASVLDMEHVARAWAGEFCRMSGVVLNA